MGARRLAAALALAAVAAMASACGGDGPSVEGATPDARQAARQLLETRDAATGVTAVACGALDFEGTYRCTVTAEGGTLVCGLASGAGADPYCLTAAADAAERRRRARLVERALAAARARGRIAHVVRGLREGNFTVGCTVGFRTVAGGAAQTDDVVIDLIAVATDTGRSFWTALTVTPGGDLDERSGVDPAEKPPTNGYGACDLDERGAATARAARRDTALLPPAARASG